MLGPQKDSLFRRTVEIFNTIVEKDEIFTINDILNKYKGLYEDRPLGSFSCFRDILAKLPNKVNRVEFGKYKKLENISDEDIKEFYKGRNKAYPPFKSMKPHKFSPSTSDKPSGEDQNTINNLLKNITEIGESLIEAQQRIAELEQELDSKQQNNPTGRDLINSLLEKIEEKTGVKLEKI